MTRLSCRILAFVLVVVVSPPLYGQLARFDAFAGSRYQGAPGNSTLNGVTNPSAGAPVVAEAITNPSGDGFSFARGFASGVLNTTGTSLRSFSYASGFDPNFDPPDEVQASARIDSRQTWVAISSVIDPSTVFDVVVTIPVSGNLFVEQFFSGSLGTNDVFAEAAASLSVDGTGVYFGSARASDPISGGTNSVLTTQGDWTGDFSTFNSLDFDIPDPDAYAIDTVDEVRFSAQVNVLYDIEFSLSSQAFTVGPFESLSVADFGNTGTYQLTAVDPVTGNPLDVTFLPVLAVPEPNSLALALLGAAVWRRRFRRQAACQEPTSSAVAADCR